MVSEVNGELCGICQENEGKIYSELMGIWYCSAHCINVSISALNDDIRTLRDFKKRLRK